MSNKKVSEKDKLDYLEISKNLRFLLSNSFNILDQKKSDNNNFIYLFLLKLFDKNIKSKIKFILSNSFSKIALLTKFCNTS